MLRPALAALLVALAPPAFAQAAIPLAAADFARSPADYEGKRVAIESCELQPYSGADGTYACLLKTPQGADATDSRGLSVYIYLDADSATRAYVGANCLARCRNRVIATGTLRITPGIAHIRLEDARLRPL